MDQNCGDTTKLNNKQSCLKNNISTNNTHFPNLNGLLFPNF